MESKIVSDKSINPINVKVNSLLLQLSQDSQRKGCL